MQRKTATVHPSFSKRSSSPQDNFYPQQSMQNNPSSSKPYMKTHCYTQSNVSPADDPTDVEENSVSYSMIKKTRKIRQLQDMRSINDCERVFINRKRTLMQKAKELEQATGAIVTVTVKSQTGEVFYFANSHATIAALERSGLLTSNATHEMSSLHLKIPSVFSNISAHSINTFNPITPNIERNHTIRRGSTSSPIVQNFSQNMESTQAINKPKAVLQKQNDTGVLSYQNANRSLKRQTASPNPINLVFESKSPKNQIKVVSAISVPSSTSDESSSSSDDSSEASSSESDSDDENNKIEVADISTKQNKLHKNTASTVIDAEVVKVSSEDDNENNDTSSDESNNSPNNKDVKLSNTKSNKSADKKIGDLLAKKCSASSSEENADSSSSEEEDSDESEDETNKELLKENQKAKIECAKPNKDIKLISSSVKAKLKPKIPENKNILTSPKFSPFVPLAAAKANALKTPLRESLGNKIKPSETSVQNDQPKDSNQSLFTNLPSWTLPNLDKKSNLSETTFTKKDSNLLSPKTINSFEDKVVNKSSLKVNEKKRQSVKFNCYFNKGEDLSAHCKKYFEYHFSDEFLQNNEAFSKYVLKQEKTARGCGVMDVLHQQDPFKVLSTDLAKHVPRKLFTHFILNALKDSEHLTFKANYISRKIPWTKPNEFIAKKRSLSESDFQDSKKMKMTDNPNAKPDRGSMDLFRYCKKYFEYCFLDSTLLENPHLAVYIAQQEDNLKSCNVLYILKRFCIFTHLKNELQNKLILKSKILGFLKSALMRSTVLTFDSACTIKRIYPWNKTASWQKCNKDGYTEKKTQKDPKKLSKKTSEKKQAVIKKTVNLPSTSAISNKTHDVSLASQKYFIDLKSKHLKNILKNPNFVTTTKLAKLKMYCQKYVEYCFSPMGLKNEAKFNIELNDMEKTGQCFTLRHLLYNVPLFFELKENVSCFSMLNAEILIEQSLEKMKKLETNRDIENNQIYIFRV